MAEALEGDQYPFSEAELTRKTGYSRQRLTQLRLGIKREIKPQEEMKILAEMSEVPKLEAEMASEQSNGKPYGE